MASGRTPVAIKTKKARQMQMKERLAIELTGSMADIQTGRLKLRHDKYEHLDSFEKSSGLTFEQLKVLMLAEDYGVISHGRFEELTMGVTC